MGGKTPKFACKITRVESANGRVQTLTEGLDQEPVKIKFGASEGWSWKELATNGRQTYEKDGLKRLGQFMQNSDNNPPPQRLVCDKEHVDTKTQPFTATCDKSIMLVQDLGKEAFHLV